MEHWGAARAAWARCASLRELQARVAEEIAHSSARRAEIEQAIMDVPADQALPLGQITRRRRELRAEFYAAVPDRSLVASAREAEAAWHELLELLPSFGRLHEDRARELQRARAVVAKLEDELERLRSRPAVARLKQRLAQVAESIKALGGEDRRLLRGRGEIEISAGHPSLVPTASHASSGARLEVARLREAKGELAKELAAEEKRAEEASEREAPLMRQIEAARSALARAESEPDTHAELAGLFAGLEASAAGAAASTKPKKGRRKA